MLRKKKDHHPKSRNPKHTSLPQTTKIRVDVATFLSTIRATYTMNAQDKAKAHETLFNHLKRYGDPLQMVLYIDGDAANEKNETRREREEKRAKSAMSAQNAITLLADRVKTGQPPTKQLFKDADTAIATDCQLQDVVLSQDSDFMAYDSVMTLWQPVRDRDSIKILEYSKAEVLNRIGLSITRLTALICVSHNDYNKNIPTLGIATNYSIVKDLPNAGNTK
ncbi:hypothetical protein BGZ73_004091 [Actinomortierella ambigua]|nr:hypothetical protein BGZ73_004091 [Actinomortierella ambigua]